MTLLRPFSEFEKARAVDRLWDARHRMLPCVPPNWARSGHQQTLIAHFLPSKALNEKGQDFQVTLESPEERIHTTYIKGRSNVVVYLFHGLGGHSEASYMQRSAVVARRLGHHVFLNNHRGCGKGSGLAVEPYHSGRAEDLSAVIEFGRKMLPHHRHIAVGFSLSANALLLLAARVRANVLPDAAIAVNAPIDLESSSRKLVNGANLIYNFSFINDLRTAIRDREKTGRLNAHYEYARVWSLRELDRIYTAPAGGFASREEYYELCSARHYLRRIDIPTVLLTAEDDPIISAADYRSARKSDSCVLHIEQHGGHLGYLARRATPLGTRRWLDYALREYLMALS